jgi:hypothetical protein
MKRFSTEDSGRIKFDRVEDDNPTIAATLAELRAAKEGGSRDPELASFVGRVGVSRCVRERWFDKGKWPWRYRGVK